VIRFEEDLGGMIDSNTLMTGFTVRNGYEYYPGGPDCCGGGMYLWSSSPTLIGVTFSDNIAYWGGGMYLKSSSNPTLTDVTFSGNLASSKGGGIYLSYSSSINASYLLINNNYSEGHGAGIFLSAGSNINLDKSTIASNIVGEGDTFGAGIYADGGTATLKNSIVYYNRRAGDYGINYNLNGYTMDILNEFTVSYSDIEGEENWIPIGVGNISISPEFNDFESKNFELQINSPCIDAGDHNSELDTDGTIADLGAFYFDQSSFCDGGYADIDEYCYYQADLDVLQLLIESSQEGENPPPPGLSPIELGDQVWENGRLTEFICTTYHPLELDYELSGGIPSSIDNLTELTYLKLVGNSLGGEIPPEIGNLINLTCLYLGADSFSGAIPPEIGNLIKLTNLDLSNNNLNGEIPIEITGLIDLNHLFLFSNELSGSIPSEIGNLQNMWYLDLRNNDLTGAIPPEIGNLNLVGLFLNDNQLIGEIPSEIGQLSYLGSLWLNDNQLSGEIPPEIGGLESLDTSLQLHNNQLRGLIPESICNLTDLGWFAEYQGGGSENASNAYIFGNQLCPPYPGCIEESVGEQNTIECAGSCPDKVTIVNQWDDGYHYDFTYTLGELQPVGWSPYSLTAQREIFRLTVTCQETGQSWFFDSDRIIDGVLIGMDYQLTANYYQLSFNVTAIDDNGDVFYQNHLIDFNPGGYNPLNDITFPELDFTTTIDYSSLDIFNAHGLFEYAVNNPQPIAYSIGHYSTDPPFVCDETCEGSLSPDGCEDSIELSLHEGSNLMSFVLLPEDNSVSNVLTDDNILAIAGEGEAAMNTGTGWVGSLTNILYENGYWLLLNNEVTLILTGPPIDPGQQYALHTGNNLISYSQLDCGSIDEVLPDDVEECIYAIAGEGVAALGTDGGWVGSLSELCPDEGYWFVNICDGITFTYNEPTGLARMQELSLSPYPYSQSSKQAFYFIMSVENIEIGDWILAYSGDKVIGTRQCKGGIIDVPAMGDDGTKYTEGYMKAGIAPEFKVQRGGKLIDLEGYVPTWSENGFFIVSHLTVAQTLPETFSLQRAYPNPFNSITTVSFALPEDNNVLLEVYDINGRNISRLIDNSMKAGYHSVLWNAERYSSGVYIIRMQAGGFRSSQKLMLVK